MEQGLGWTHRDLPEMKILWGLGMKREEKRLPRASHRAHPMWGWS